MQYLVTKLYVLTLLFCALNSCKQKNATIVGKDDTYKLDSAINTLNNIKWTKKTNSNSFSSLIDTTIELPEDKNTCTLK